MAYNLQRFKSEVFFIRQSSTRLEVTERSYAKRSLPSPPARLDNARNRPFPSSAGPLYQNEVKCSAFDKEMIFHSHAKKLIFTKRCHMASF